jgi:hypothetical protein
MKNFKLELFNFKQKLTIDQTDIMRIVEGHMNACDNYSEKEVYNSLNLKLTPFVFDAEVKDLLENLRTEIEQNSLTADLKDLYKRVERKNHSHMYRQPLNTILSIITKENDEAKMEAVLNELSIHDWVPEIKRFMIDVKKNPIEIQNYKNAGNGEKVFTLVEKVEGGFLAYVGNRWFLLSESEIKQVIPDDYIKDENKIKQIRILEEAIKRSEITNEKISFKIDENLKISMSTKNGNLFLNEDKADEGSTLENIFDSPIVPYLKKDYYMILKTVNENLNKFVELDIAIKVSNQVLPFLESFAFNYKDKMYLYNIDKRTGSSFFQYESVNSLVLDVQKSLDYDLSYFFENKLSKEVKHLKSLEDRERKINLKIKETNEAIALLEDDKDLLNEDTNLKKAFDNLLVVKENLTKELQKVVSDKKEARKLIK